MIWKEIVIKTKEDTAEILGGILMSQGIESWEVVDNKLEKDPFTGEIYPELQPDTRLGEDFLVRFYLNEDDDEVTILKVIRENIKGAEITLGHTNDEDWRDKWKEYFHAFNIEDVWIVPTWEEIPKEALNNTLIRIDPGISFGTGTHETTRLCIKALIHQDLNGKRVLDVGCGSGILSIVSMLRGAKHVTGIDIDPDAVISSEENLTLNGIDSRDFNLYAGNLATDENLDKSIPDGSFDIVVTNILADIIIGLLPSMVKKLKPGGLLIASGIIDFKENDVEIAFNKNNLKVTDKFEDGDWRAVYGMLS